MAAVFRALRSGRWHADDLQPLFARLGPEQAGRILVGLTALEQVGLVAEVERDGARLFELVPAAGKKDLSQAPILKSSGFAAANA